MTSEVAYNGNSMERIRTTVVIVSLVIHCVPRTDGQTLYSAFVNWMPTAKVDEFQFVYHLSWNQQNNSCKSPACLQAYATSNVTVQILNRWPGYHWTCLGGCSSVQVISDLSRLMFTEATSFLEDKWEAGEERIVYAFSSDTGGHISIGLSDANNTLLPDFGEAYMILSVRNDTKRANVSPVVSVLPIYRAPFGCNITVKLFPFDGDGDDVRCRWVEHSTNRLPAASLDGSTCTIHIEVTTKSGYTAGKLYKGSLYVEDYARLPVRLTRGHRTSVTYGPFSRAPVVFSVHVAVAPKDPGRCLEKPVFASTRTDNFPNLYRPPFVNKTLQFIAKDSNTSFVTVGPRGMLFLNRSAGGLSSEWSVKDRNMIGQQQACALAYSAAGVPGETHCETILVGGTDQCSPNPCVQAPGGTCRNQWQRHTCSYPSEDNSSDKMDNLGLLVGLPVGLFVCLCAIMAGTTIYLRRLWLKNRRVLGEKKSVEP